MRSVLCFDVSKFIAGKRKEISDEREQDYKAAAPDRSHGICTEPHRVVAICGNEQGRGLEQLFRYGLSIDVGLFGLLEKPDDGRSRFRA